MSSMTSASLGVWYRRHRRRSHETRRLVPPQILGPGGTLLSVPPQNFCRQMLLELKCFLWDQKYTEIDFGRDFAPDPTELTPHPRLHSWWGGGLAAPLPRTPLRLGPSSLKLRPLWPRFSVPPHFWLPSAAPDRRIGLCWKSLTRGRTDYFINILLLWPWTLSYNLDL